jgi:hypothetical protein
MGTTRSAHARYRIYPPTGGRRAAVEAEALHSLLKWRFPSREQEFCKPQFRKYAIKAQIEGGGTVHLLIDGYELTVTLSMPSDAGPG